VTQSRRTCECGFVFLALDGHIKVLFFAWEFPDLVTETWGVQSEFRVWNI